MLLLVVVHAVVPHSQHSLSYSLCAGGEGGKHPLPLLFLKPEQVEDLRPTAPSLTVNS